MPWQPEDASRFTHKANTPKKREAWARVANSTLDRTGNEGLAVREANGVVRDAHHEEKRKRRRQ